MTFVNQPAAKLLKLGGVLALTPLVAQMIAQTASAKHRGNPPPFWHRTRPCQPTHSGTSFPPLIWQSGALPIGNGRLGAMFFGDPTSDRIQFNEQSLWGGANNYDNALAGKPDGAYDTSVTGFGSYRNFGNVVVSFNEQPVVTSPGGPYKIWGAEGVEASVDKNTGTKWCIDGPPATVTWQIKLPSAVVVSRYTLTSANDVPARDPQKWTFSGSQNGESWTALDTQSLPAPFEEVAGQGIHLHETRPHTPTTSSISRPSPA